MINEHENVIAGVHLVDVSIPGFKSLRWLNTKGKNKFKELRKVQPKYTQCGTIYIYAATKADGQMWAVANHSMWLRKCNHTWVMNKYYHKNLSVNKKKIVTYEPMNVEGLPYFI